MIWATPRSEHVDWLFDFDTGGSSRLLYRVVSFAAILIWIWVGVEQHERNQPTHANVVAYISWYLWACDAYNDFDIEMNHKQSTSKAAVILQTRDIRAQRHKCGSTCWYYTNYTLHYIIVLRIYIYIDLHMHACIHTFVTLLRKKCIVQQSHCKAWLEQSVCFSLKRRFARMLRNLQNRDLLKRVDHFRFSPFQFVRWYIWPCRCLDIDSISTFTRHYKIFCHCILVSPFGYFEPPFVVPSYQTTGLFYSDLK